MNGRVSRLLRPVYWLMAMVLLAGCSPSPRIPVSYHLSFLAHPQLSQSAPLRISVLQLTSDMDFMAADFWSLQTRTQQVLGGSLLHMEQFWLRAGQLNKTISGDITPGARYIGIIAEYPLPDGKSWRLSLSLGHEPRAFPLWPGAVEEARAEVIVDTRGVRALR